MCNSEMTNLALPIARRAAAAAPEAHKAAPQTVIFLDVDGVLHSLYGEDLFRTTCCELLARIVGATGASLVLSSTWRTEPGKISVLNAALRQWNLAPAVDCTKELDCSREAEICEWLDRNPQVIRWIAIDDMDLVSGTSVQAARLRGHFVRTNAATGLAAGDADLAVQLLRGQANLPAPPLHAPTRAGSPVPTRSPHTAPATLSWMPPRFVGAPGTSAAARAYSPCAQPLARTALAHQADPRAPRRTVVRSPARSPAHSPSPVRTVVAAPMAATWPRSRPQQPPQTALAPLRMPSPSPPPPPVAVRGPPAAFLGPPMRAARKSHGDTAASPTPLRIPGARRKSEPGLHAAAAAPGPCCAPAQAAPPRGRAPEAAHRSPDRRTQVTWHAVCTGNYSPPRRLPLGCGLEEPRGRGMLRFTPPAH